MTYVFFLLLKLTFSEPFSLTLQSAPSEALLAACRMDENCMDIETFQERISN